MTCKNCRKYLKQNPVSDLCDNCLIVAIDKGVEFNIFWENLPGWMGTLSNKDFSIFCKALKWMASLSDATKSIYPSCNVDGEAQQADIDRDECGRCNGTKKIVL